jgi:REP element-mobilizing transposase RayT
MPRRARLDSPGTLHHVIVRGIEGRNIVEDDNDRSNIISRLGNLAEETKTDIYAWALMPNHMHILLKSGSYGLSKFMRRLLTGYAITFNKRHNRNGHVFQNRYKSIVCDEDVYFKELVRYIHLNPLRVDLVKDMPSLDNYPWCGHSAIMGMNSREWQDINYVLSDFGATGKDSINNYRKYVEDGISEGRRNDLVGGGLVRTLGGWSQVISSRKRNDNVNCDDRILGKNEFVERVISEADSKIKGQVSVNIRITDANKLIQEICKNKKVNIAELKGGSRRGEIPEIRAYLAKLLPKYYGLTFAETARQLGVTTSAVSKIYSRNKG